PSAGGRVRHSRAPPARGRGATVRPDDGGRAGRGQDLRPGHQPARGGELPGARAHRRARRGWRMTATGPREGLSVTHRRYVPASHWSWLPRRGPSSSQQQTDKRNGCWLTGGRYDLARAERFVPSAPIRPANRPPSGRRHKRDTCTDITYLTFTSSCMTL